MSQYLPYGVLLPRPPPGQYIVGPNPDTPTGMSPLITPPASAGPANAHQCAMRVQVLLEMGQYHLSREEARELLDQWVHIVTTAQDLRHSTRKLVRVAGDYLGDEGPLSQAMDT